MTPITLPVAELKSGLPGLGKVIHPKSTLPVLQSLRVERTPDGWVCLTATDLDRFVTLRLEQPAKGEPLAMMVPYGELLKLTKSSGKDERLQLEPGPEGTVTIHFSLGSQSGQTKVQSPPVEEFPVIPKIVTGKAFPISEELRTALHEATACCSSDPTRAVLHGAFLDVTRPKAHYVVATDGRHLYSCNSFQLPIQRPVIIPRHKFISWREFNLDGPWQMKVADGTDAKAPPWVQLSSRRWRFITRQIDGPYPNWRAVVPDTKPRVVIEVDLPHLKAFIQTLERLPCHDERYHTLGLEWKTGVLSLLGKQRTDDPWTRVPVENVKTLGHDLTVFVDREHVLKALSFGLSTLDLVDDRSPLRFSRGGRQMIVMPLLGDAVHPGSHPAPQRPAPPPATRPVASSATPPPHAETTRTPPMPDNEDTHINQDGARRISAADIARGTPPRDPAERPALEAALAHLETIKAGCREAVAELTRLSDVLKQALRDQRISHRETQTMRSTLRTLQSLRL